MDQGEKREKGECVRREDKSSDIDMQRNTSSALMGHCFGSFGVPQEQAQPSQQYHQHCHRQGRSNRW